MRCLGLPLFLSATVLTTAGCATGQVAAPSPEPTAAPSAAMQFSPLKIDGLLLWLDAADQGTLFADNEANTLAGPAEIVAVWRDKSASQTHAVQTEAALRPQRYSGPESQGPSLRFRATGERSGTAMLLPGFESAFGLPEWTAFLALKVDRAAKNGTALMAVAADGSQRRGVRFVDKCPAGACPEFKSKGSSLEDLRVQEPTSGDWETWEILMEAGSIRLLMDGQEKGSRALDTSHRFDWVAAAVGGRPHNQGRRPPAEAWSGHIGEILFYDRALDENERNQVRTYLTSKWPPTGVVLEGKPQGSKKRRSDETEGRD